MIVEAVRGTLNSKTPEATQELIEEKAMNSYQWQATRLSPSKPASVYDIDAIIALVVQLEVLSKKVDGISVTPKKAQVMQYDFYGKGDA